MITTKTNHVAEAIEKLLAQFKGSAKIEGLLTSYIEEAQELETILGDLRATMDLETATAEALNRLGRIVGVERAGASDSQYRTAIKAGIKVNQSRGTHDDIISLVDFLLGDDTGVTIERGAAGTAEFTAELDLDLPAEVSWNLLIYYICRASQGAGTGFVEFPYDTTTGFYWDTTNWDDGTQWGSAASTRTCLTEYEADELGLYQDYVDNVAPTVTIESTTANVVDNGTPAVWTVTFSDDLAINPATTLGLLDVTLTGTDNAIGIDTVTGSNPYTVTTFPTTTVSSDLRLRVLADVVEDTSGNGNPQTDSDPVLIQAASAFDNFSAAPITISGTDYSPTYAWSGNDATGSSWPLFTGSGISLVQSNGGTATTGVTCPIDGLDGVTNGSSLDCWVDAAASALDLSAGEDIIIEVIYQHQDAQRLCASVTNTANEGVTARTTGRMVINAEDSDGDSTQMINLANPVDNDWYYGAFILTRGVATSQAYVYDNVTGLSAGSTATVTNSITSADGQTYLAGLPGAGMTNPIAWVAIYKDPGIGSHGSGSVETALDARVTLLGGTPGSGF
jgi:hypothetical protein